MLSCVQKYLPNKSYLSTVRPPVPNIEPLVCRSVRCPSVVNNSFESLLLLQFSTNLNQTWHKVRTPRGAKIVGSGILNFCFVWEKADDFVIFQQFIQIATPPTVLNQS